MSMDGLSSEAAGELVASMTTFRAGVDQVAADMAAHGEDDGAAWLLAAAGEAAARVVWATWRPLFRSTAAFLESAPPEVLVQISELLGRDGSWVDVVWQWAAQDLGEERPEP